MAKIKQIDSDGNEEEIEVLTEEEKKALEESHKGQLAEKDTALSTLANEKKELEEKIAKLENGGEKDDHPNFKILREALAKKDSEISTIKSDLENDKKQRIAEEMDTKIKLASKGNDEFEKKVRFHLETTLGGLPDGTKEQRQTKFEAALKLSSDSSSDGQGIFDGGIGGGNRGSFSGKENAPVNEFTAKEKALGAKLGLTPEDYKKYANRVSKRN